MKILVVGSGGREHAIIRKLAESPKVDKIYAAPGNGGISCDAECVAIGAMDKEGMVSFAKENEILFSLLPMIRWQTVWWILSWQTESEPSDLLQMQP